ncbi:integrase catalytic domain-containing protein [Trichonephila clavipes]|nr:integrase catalytic domain-containing protein [Trichonephila clavipes]
MALKLNLKKDELISVAVEMGLEIPSKAKIIDLKKLIESSAVYKNDIEFVRSHVENALEKNCVCEREAEIQLEKIKLSQIEKQLELAKVRKESEKNSQSLESGEPSSITDKLESLVKSIKTLTIEVPVRSESFNLFFHSLEKAFPIKSVPDELKTEILLNILGERVNNLLTYVSQEDLSNYVKIKELILREFEPTPQECLSNFKKARKLPSENYVQFASRLSATFDYYCQLRKVNEFRSLCDLIISDKIFETLDRDTMNHIATKQGETYFKPQQLGRECDVYLSARGKVSNDLMSRNPGSAVKTDGRNRLQTVSTWRQERNSSNVFVAETKPNCVLCKGNDFHPLSKCYQFKKLSVEDKVEVVKRNNLCFRCFLPHRLKECLSEKNCFCLRHHNSLIHFSRDKTRNPTPTSNLNLDAPTFVPGQIEESVEANSLSQFVVTGFEKGRLKNVFLSTVRALVKNKYSQWVEVRCLLDVGSQSCLCTRACAEKLQLKMEKINTVVSCVNDASMVVKNCVKTSVANKVKTFESELMLLVVNKITDLIPNKVIDVDVNVSEFVPLADDKFNIPDRIDIVTKYGVWLCCKWKCRSQVTENRVHCGLIVDDDLNKTLKKFWEIEGVHIEPKVDTEVSLCEDHFVRTHRRNCEGRYVVSLALNKDPSCLGNSKDIAIRRLNSLWKRLSRDSSYLSLYAEFLKEYEELGHLERVVESSELPTHYYIPHHGVLRPEKLTTKLRIVFNGSSPTTTGISLNDLLLKGEVKEDVFEALSRFRRHKFAFTTDIQKMYRQILINPDQQDLQRIIWKHGLDAEILTYRLKTVTYGLSNAPFLAIRTLQQLAKDEKSRFPLASETLLYDTYMDDIVSGVPDLETAQQLQSQLKDALQSCGMNLHKWSSNSPELLNSSLSSDVEHSFSTDIDLSVKTLGISWKPFEDCFAFKVSVSAKHIYTKREVLSVIAKLYDPLGFLGPVIAKAKVFLQQLWQCKLEMYRGSEN